MTTPLVTEQAIEIIYLISATLFILSLKWLSAPATARRGVFAGEIGMILAIGATLLYLQMDRHRACARHDHRHPAGARANDGGPAADGFEPCFRCIVRSAGRHLGVLFARA
jgi:hypothetical protein